MPPTHSALGTVSDPTRIGDLLGAIQASSRPSWRQKVRISWEFQASVEEPLRADIG
jgi:hypothetical protein